MSRQDQKVGEGGQAIQTQTGDVVINQGLTPQQMLQIMEGVGQQIQRGIDRAAAVIDERLQEFREDLAKEFAEPDTLGKSEAFNDPDFQYALHEAQKGFARSGEQGLKEELIKLLAHRSAEPGRTRTALILNEAIQTISSLTPQDISALAVLFVFNHIQITNPATPSEIFGRYREWIRAFIKDFPTDNHSFEYLASMRCLIINSIGQNDVWAMLRVHYGNLFARRFSSLDLTSALVGQTVPTGLVAVALDQFSTALRFVPRTREELVQLAANASLTDPATANLQALWERTNLTDNELVALVSRELPELATIAKRWAETSARSSGLTALGKAIAHSALTSRTNFNAPLEIWVK